MTKKMGELTWEEIQNLDFERTIALLPVGAIEAHGPHLPLETDVLIACAMTDKAAILLETQGYTPLVLPPLVFTPAPFAEAFSGTIALRPQVATEVLIDIGTSLARGGLKILAIANSHFDPANLSAITLATNQLKELYPQLKVIFPNLTRRPWRERLGDEFNSGACHAGRYETSIVLAVRPDLVRTSVCETLQPNPHSLSEAIRRGVNTFADAGGARAYFGSPNEASIQEGKNTIDILGGILCDSIYEALT